MVIRCRWLALAVKPRKTNFARSSAGGAEVSSGIRGATLSPWRRNAQSDGYERSCARTESQSERSAPRITTPDAALHITPDSLLWYAAFTPHATRQISSLAVVFMTFPTFPTFPTPRAATNLNEGRIHRSGASAASAFSGN
ncbi:hypothetical protein I7I51_01925 [Histoplasma capsulatum]|uniref:Uncharacterized protein n=1 Tax=Ajellomyces capsulatus TaxID=5037 RepID=A0A8A1MFX9_AJECA|nr:hypothetical protein I7I51_01925 [Histoplasma capsulatum]